MNSESPGNGEGTLVLALELNPPDDWEQLLQADPSADYFHTSHWTCCVRDHFPHMSAYWLTARLQDRLVGGLSGVKRSKPAPRWESGLEGTSGGPLLDHSLSNQWRDKVFAALIAEYVGLRGTGLGTTCLSLNHPQERTFGPWMTGSEVAWKYQETPAAVIPLDGGLEFVEMNLMKKNKRNERNRALRRGASVVITHDPDLLAAYYPIYESASERWQLPPAPLSFLQALLNDQSVLPSGIRRTFFTCLMLGDDVIGGHLNLQYGGRVTAWNGVTDPHFARSHFPATLAVWGDIEESCRRGASLLDLGGSGGVVSLDGFKKHFGAISESRGHYVLDSLGMKILRGGRKLLHGLRPGSSTGAPQRWHDDSAEDDSGS